MIGIFKGRKGEVRHGFSRRVKRFSRNKATGRIMTAACVVSIAFLLISAMSVPLFAETYPSKPIRFILPFPAGDRPISWVISWDRI